MSQCLCPQRRPCPIHKDRPLEMPDVVEHHTYVMRVYHVWSEQKWFSTLAKDALRIQETEKFSTKQEAINAIKL